MKGSLPYWRLSAFYLFFFASVGAFVPYWSLYLDSRGFSAAEIGELMAILMATRVLAPNVWGWIADHTQQRMRIVRVGTLCTVIAFCGVFWNSGYWWLAAVMAVFSFFWNAALPQFEATTLNHLGSEVEKYSRIRVWGSIGFIIAVTALGAELDTFSLDVLPWVVTALLVGIWLSSLIAPGDAKAWTVTEQGSLKDVLRRRYVLSLLVVCFLVQASHGPYYTFYSLYLEDHGYARMLIGQLWALGVVAEVGVFLVLHRMVKRWGLRFLLLASLVLTTIRWAMIGAFPESFSMLVIAQLFHAASFGIFHAVAIQFIHRYFVGRSQGRGQALYSSAGFGAGGAMGSFYAGHMWDAMGPTTTFGVAAALSFAALAVAAWGVKE